MPALGNCKPYEAIVNNALEQTCRRNGVVFRPEDARWVYEQVRISGPHPDVPADVAPRFYPALSSFRRLVCPSRAG